MKRWKLFPVLILIALINYGNMPALAQQEEEISEIKRVVESFIGGFANQDLDSMMSQVSANFSDIDKDGNVIDYAKFKSLTQQWLHLFFTRIVDFAYTNSGISILDFKDDKVRLEIKSDWKGFNLDALKEINIKRKWSASLAKENSNWKITQWSLKGGKILLDETTGVIESN